jgi:GNAT superfamily N-acetyltransferase
VPRLSLARGDQLDAVYRESHVLWGSGLTLGDYRGLWDDVSRTAWGGRYAGFYVWVDDRGVVLSSVKLYRPRLRLHGQTFRATVIGALFTPRAVRGRGHASSLVRAVLSQARDRGDRLALLFSDIGTRFYSALGFRVLPAEEDWGTLPHAPAAPPEGSLRPFSDADAEAVHRAHHDFCSSRPLAMLRDAEHWHFLDVRSRRFFDRLQDGRVRQRQQVAQVGGRFAGYLVALEGRRDWGVREVGAPGGDPRAMAEILRLGAARARREGLRAFYGWLPPGVKAHLTDWKIRTRPRRRAMPMVCGLDPEVDLSRLGTPQLAYLPFQDQF